MCRTERKKVLKEAIEGEQQQLFKGRLQLYRSSPEIFEVIVKKETIGILEVSCLQNYL